MKLSLDLKMVEGEFQLDVARDVDLTGVTALFGPSGAGKSSVLNAIAGFLPSVGRVSLDGMCWQDQNNRSAFVPPHRRPIGIVFQNGRLFPHLSVADNLAFGAKRAATDGPQLSAGDVVSVMEIGALLPRKPATLSGGEAQRVAIARALLTRPKLMLMDEPLSGIDRQRKNIILRMIGDLPKRFGVPVIFVSHLVEEVAHISDQLVAMQGGRIVGVGATSSMLEHLGAEVTGHFETGSLLEGEVTECDPELSIVALDVGAGTLWMPTSLAVNKGERLRVRLRARDVSLSLAPLSGVSIRNQLPVVVTDIAEEQGPFAELRLDCGGQTIRARVTRLAVRDLGLAPGQEAFALVKSVAFDRRLGGSAVG